VNAGFLSVGVYHRVCGNNRHYDSILLSRSLLFLRSLFNDRAMNDLCPLYDLFIKVKLSVFVQSKWPLSLGCD